MRRKGLVVFFFLLIVFVLSILTLVMLELISHTDLPETLQEAAYKYRNAPKLDMTVSFTTVPNRLKTGAIQATLISLLVQNPAPSDIVINIPYVMKRKGTVYEIPGWLPELPVRVRRCEDWGPATKYIPTLAEFIDKNDLERLILILDDDVIVPAKNSIEKIFNYGQKYPDKVVTGHAYYLLDKDGANPHFDPITTFVEPKRTIFGTLTARWSRYVKEGDEYCSADVVLGYQGYLLRPKMIDFPSLIDYEHMPPEAFFVDDVVMSANLASKKIERVVVPGWPKLRMGSSMAFGYVRSLFLRSSRDESLATTVNLGEHNNRTMTKHFVGVW